MKKKTYAGRRVGIRAGTFALAEILALVLALSSALPAATFIVTSTSGSNGAGTLRGQIDNAAAADTIAFSFIAGTTVTLAGTADIDVNLTIDGSGAQNLTLGGSGVALIGAATGTFNINAGNTHTINSVVSGTGTLAKAGVGTLTLGGVNTYSGGTVLNSGIVSVAADSNLGTGSLTFNGGSLLLNASVVSANDMAVNAPGGGIDTNIWSLTHSGVISGSGVLTKSGTGSLILTGNSSHSGLTIVQAGTLLLGVANALSVGASVNLDLAATLDLSSTAQAFSSLTGSGFTQLGSGSLTLAPAGSDTYAGVISGTGSLTMNGAGSLALIGANTYSGGTTLSNGILSIASDNNLGSGSLTASGGGLRSTAGITSAKNLILNAAIMTFDTNGFDSSWSGVVSGAGQLYKSGSGTLTLSGANTYSGGTRLEGGTVAVSGDANLGTGALIFDGGTLQASGGILSSKNISLQAGGGTLDLQGTSSLSGVISGTGALTKQGTGLLVLSGVSTYTGGTNLLAGILNIGSAGNTLAAVAGDIAVSSGSFLRGYGSVGGSVINNGSVQAQGDSSAFTLGALSQAAGATATVGVAPGNFNSSRFAVFNAALDGTLYVLSSAGAYGIRHKYTVLTASNSLTGSFSSVTSNQATMDPSLLYGSSGVTLVLTRNDADFAAFGETENQKALGDALSAAVRSDMDDAYADLLNTLYLLPAGQQDALRTIGGSTYASLATVMLSNDHTLETLLSRAAGSGIKPPSGRFFTGLNKARKAGRPAPKDPLALWVETGSWVNSLAGDGNAEGYKSSGTGFLAGSDLPLLRDVTTGVSLGFSRQSLDSDLAPAAHSDVDSLLAGIYFGHERGLWDYTAAFQLAMDSYQNKRSMVIGSSSFDTSSTFGGLGLGAALRVSRAIKLKQVMLRPLAGLQCRSLSMGAFTEAGAGSLDLNVAAQSYLSLQPVAGINAARNFKVGKIHLASSGTLLLSQEVLNPAPKTEASLAGDPDETFIQTGVAPDATQAGLAAELAWLASEVLNISIGYRGSLGATQLQHNLNAGAGFRF